MFLRKAGRLAAVAILTVCALAPAFASGGKEQATSASASSGPTDISYLMWEDPTYTSIVQGYNDSQKEIVVTPQIVTSADYETKLTTMLAGGAQMDAYMQKRQTDMFAQYANGYIQPLDALIKKYNYDTSGLDKYKSAVTIDGKIVAIPFRGAMYYTYYNKKLFKEAGIDTPDQYVKRGEWNWKTFMNVAEKLSSGDGKQYGALLYIWGLLQVIPAIQDNVSFITSDGKIDINNTVLQSFKMRKELEQKKAIIPLVDLLTTKLHYSTGFFKGNVGMLLIGEWFPGMMLNAKEKGLLQGFTWNDWGVTRLPSDQPTYASMGAPTFSHVHADSKKKDAAFKFIGWMGSAQGAKVVASAGFLPPIVTPDVKAALAKTLPDTESLDYFTEKAKVIPPYYTRYGSRVEQVINNTMQKYLLNNMSDAELMSSLRSSLQEVINTTN